MARIRSVKPEYFTSLAIAHLSIEARLCFIGLWTHCDDEGRCLDECRLIKAAVFPLDDEIPSAAVGKIVDELVTAGRLIRYTAAGAALLQIVGWRDHQKIDRRSPSKWPAPPDHQPVDVPSSTARRGIGEGSSPDLRISGAGAARDEHDAHTPADSPPAAAPAPRDQVNIDVAAATIIAERRDIQANSLTKNTPARWRNAAMRGILSEIEKILPNIPEGATALDVANLVEPDRPEPTPLTIPTTIDHSICTECDGHGWIHHTDDKGDESVSPCPLTKSTEAQAS